MPGGRLGSIFLTASFTRSATTRPFSPASMSVMAITASPSPFMVAAPMRVTLTHLDFAELRHGNRYVVAVVNDDAS